MEHIEQSQKAAAICATGITGVGFNELNGANSFEKKALSKWKFCCDLHNMFFDRASIGPAATADDLLESEHDEEARDDRKDACDKVTSINTTGDKCVENELMFEEGTEPKEQNSPQQNSFFSLQQKNPTLLPQLSKDRKRLLVQLHHHLLKNHILWWIWWTVTQASVLPSMQNPKKHLHSKDSTCQSVTKEGGIWCKSNENKGTKTVEKRKCRHDQWWFACIVSRMQKHCQTPWAITH